MSGSTARLSAIDAVKRYQAPAVFFPPMEAPGEIFGERWQRGSDDIAEPSSNEGSKIATQVAPHVLHIVELKPRQA